MFSVMWVIDRWKTHRPRFNNILILIFYNSNVIWQKYNIGQLQNASQWPTYNRLLLLYHLGIASGGRILVKLSHCIWWSNVSMMGGGGGGGGGANLFPTRRTGLRCFLLHSVWKLAKGNINWWAGFAGKPVFGVYNKKKWQKLYPWNII